MPVVTSSYPQPQQPPNFAQTLGSVAGTIGQLNQNKLFGQQYQTNLATSQIYKEAMNPDGSIDQNKLAGLLQSNPNAAYGIGPVLEQSQQIQHQNIVNNQAKYDLLKNHLTTLTNYLGPLAAGDPTANDVAATISHAITTGVATPQEGGNMWSTLPRDSQGNVDPTQIKSWAQNNLQRVQSAAEQYGITNPAPTQVNTGGQTHLIVAPQNGAPRDVGQITNTLPPTTSTVGPGNVPQALGPVTSQLQVPGQPSQTTGSQQQQSALSGPVQTGLAPGVSEAASDQAKASAQQGIALQQRSDSVPQTKALLGNLESELDSFTPGPGADWSKVAGAFSNRLMQSFGLPGIDPTSIQSQEQFNKMAGMIAQTQFQSLGGTGTDKQLGSTELTSPNSELSKLGNKGIIAMLKGNEDAIATKNKAWQQYQQQHGPQSYGQFSTQFNQSYDPRVFQSQYLPPDDIKKMLTGMTKPEQKGFLNSYRTALSNGWVTLPNGK